MSALMRRSPFFSNDPFEEFEKIFGEMNRLPSTSHTVSPSIDMYEEDGNVIVEMPLAGVEPDKVDISIKDDTLHIKGKMERRSEVEDKDYYRHEIRRGFFQRAVPLPTSVVPEETRAMSENGMLKVALPKRTETEPEGGVKVEIERNE